IAQQRTGDALGRLERIREINDAGGYLSRQLRHKLNEFEVTCRLQLGEVGDAARIVASAPPEDICDETLAQLELRLGRADRAATRLTSDTSSNIATEVRRLMLLARAEYALGHEQAAWTTTRAAVDAGRPEGYIRPFLEDVRHTLPLLRTIAQSGADVY